MSISNISEENDEIINILYCGNENAFDGMLIGTLSIVKHTSSPVNMYILTMDLTDIDKKHTPITKLQTDYLEAVLHEKNESSHVSLIDITNLFCSEMLGSPNMNSFYTPYCLLRLFADEVDDLPDKILYLDTDIVINGDIIDLYSIDIGDHEIGAVEDYLGKWFKYHGYINSGVLLMNLPKIHETHLFQKTRECCATKKMWFPDQDSLNSLVQNKLMLPTRYNAQRRMVENTLVRHFSKSIRLWPYYHTINVKPWEVERVHKLLKLHNFDDILEDYQRRIAIFNRPKSGQEEVQSYV